MLKTVRISEASWRVMEEHSKDLKVWREELRTIAGSRTGRQSRHQKFLETWRRELFEGSCAGSSRVVWNIEMWASVEEVDILVSCRAIRSGGREEEARSVNAVEFLAFNRERILRE